MYMYVNIGHLHFCISMILSSNSSAVIPISGASNLDSFKNLINSQKWTKMELMMEKLHYLSNLLDVIPIIHVFHRK